MDAIVAAVGLGVLAIACVAFGVWFQGRDLRSWNALAPALGLQRRGRTRFKDLVGTRDEVPLMVKHLLLRRDGDERAVSRVITAADQPMAPGLSLTLSPTRHVRVMGVKVTGRYGDDLSARYTVSCKDDALADAMLLNPMVKPILDAMVERRETAAAVKANTVQITRPWLQAKEIPQDVEQAVDLARTLGLAWKAPFVQLANAKGLALEKTADAWSVRGQTDGRDVRVLTSLVAGRMTVEVAVATPALPPRLRVTVRSGGGSSDGGIAQLPDLRVDGATQAEANLLLARPSVRSALVAVLGAHPRSELRDRRVLLRTGSWPPDGLGPLLAAALRLATALEEEGDDPLLSPLDWDD